MVGLDSMAYVTRLDVFDCCTEDAGQCRCLAIGQHVMTVQLHCMTEQHVKVGKW